MNSVTKLCALFTGLAVNFNFSPVSEPIPEPADLPEYYITAGNTAYSLEDYVAGIVMAEVPYTFEPDALMAQAVAARTYCLYNLNRGVSDDESISCAFETRGRIAERFGEDYADNASQAAVQAAEATAGQVLVSDGDPILAVWHASSRGSTEAGANVWNGELSYLISVTSPEETEKIKTTAQFTLAEVKNLLEKSEYKYDMKDSVSMTKNSSNRCGTLTIGNITLSGTKARTIFGLRSTDFTAKISEGKLVFTVYGYGHGVGMSQLGAEKFAKSGYNYTEILAHYYPGSSLLTLREIYGIIS